MTERDRLVELIGSKVCEDYSPNCDEWQPHSCEKCYANDCRIGDLADYLFASGVVVLPVKVGDKVYRIVKMSTGVRTKIKAVSEKGGTTGIMTSCDPTIKRFIRCVTVTKNNIVNCCENYGKTVFLTKEEAEEGR